MKKLLFMLALVLWQCSSEKKEQMSLSHSMSIQSVVTGSLDGEGMPINNVSHLPDFLDNFYLHTTFSGIANGTHSYYLVVTNAEGVTICQDSPVTLVSQAALLRCSSQISASGCLTGPGEYTLKVYLDDTWVVAKKIWKLTAEETASGTFEPWWEKDNYMKVFPAASVGDEWLVKKVATISGAISNLFVTTHLGFNRIFYVQRTRQTGDIAIMEHRANGAVTVFQFPNGEDSNPRSIRFQVSGDKLYFYNKNVLGSYDLKTGYKIENDPLPLPPSSDNGFDSPGHERRVTTKAILDGKESLVSAEQYCNDPTVMWVSWDQSVRRLYYWIECGQGSEYGFFVRDLATGKPQRLLTDIDGYSYPFHFENNETDFVAFIEQEEGGDAVLKIATQASYPRETGFGPNFTWGRALVLPASVKDGNGTTLKVDFYSPLQVYLSFRLEDENDGMAGEITKIGSIKEGDWAGRDVYRLYDWGTMGDMDDKSEVAYRTREYTYLIRNENELIVINVDNGESKEFRIVDLDGKRVKSELFKGVTAVTLYTNLFIAGLHSPQLVDLPNSAVKLKRWGVYEEMDKANFRKLFDHPTEGEIYVKQSDDGSFWRFNGDGTVTLYAYQYDFKDVTGKDARLSLEEYVPYTNRNCQGNPLNMADILTPDPSRLMEIGTTDTNEPIFSYASAQDEGLIDEFDGLKKAFEQGGTDRTFKSIDEFIKSTPLFLWKDPFGRYVRWINTAYLTPSNCEPILYLYPETTTDVTVELGEKVNVFNSCPLFQSNWQLTASSDGTFVDKATAKSYDRIFWEGISGHLPPLEKGFVVDTADLTTFFNETLSCLGLNAKETKDFQDAWLKEFKGAPYYFIGFYDREVIDWYAPMNITPAPATVIRILMDYRPLAESIYVESPVIVPRPERKGFVAVEWAGVKRFPVSGSRFPGASD